MFKVTPIIDPRRFETYTADFSPKFLTSRELEEYSLTHRYFRVETVRWGGFHGAEEEQVNQELSEGSED
jgi:hypothetical protein